MTTSWSRPSLDRAALLCMFTAQAFCAAFFVVLCVHSLRAWYPLDYGEGVLLDQLMRLSHGQGVYPPSLAVPPYLVTNYPPTFLLAQVPFAWLFGPAYWYGRLISQVSACVTALCAGATIFHLTRDRVAAFATAGLVLSAPIVGTWGQVSRVDLFAAALSWIGLLLLVSRPRRTLWIVAASIVAAGFTRQTSWLPPVAAGAVWLWAAGEHRAANRLMLSVIGAGAVVFVVLQAATSGFTLHVVTAHRDPWDVDAMLVHFRAVMRWLPPMILLATAGAVAGLVRRDRSTLFAVAYFAAAALNGVWAGKAGAFENYFVEVSIGFAVLAGLAVRHAQDRFAYRVAACALVTIQAAGAAFLYAARVAVEPPEARAIVTEMQRTQGPVIADTAIGLIPLAGHRVLIEPSKLGIMALTGRWDESPFLDDLTSHRVQLAVLQRTGGAFRPQQFTPAMVQAIERHYRVCAIIPAARSDTDYVLYRPRCARASE